jgi:AraC-like DNA-binding protein
MTWKEILEARAETSPKRHRIEKELREFQVEAHPDAEELPVDIKRLLDSIHQHLFDPHLNVGSALRHCGLRNHNISTRFRSLLGLTVREYIEQFRLEAARRLLENQEIEVFLVTAAVGYVHPETFCRAFSRRFGCTPSEYRSRNRKTATTDRRVQVPSLPERALKNSSSTE